MPFDTMGDAHKHHLLPLAFLTPVQMVLHVCEWPRAARGTEAGVLHCECELVVSGDEQGILGKYKWKPDESPLT